MASKITAAVAEAGLAATGIRDSYIRQLREFSTCDVGDALVRLGSKKGGHIHSIKHVAGTPFKICGPALPVKMGTYGGGLGQAHKPMVDYTKPGKITIIQTPVGKAGNASACWGAVESARAKVLKAEGVIVGGNVRQVSDCHEIGLPVFSTGTAALGPREYMRLAKVGEQISISGVDVSNDDILLADEHGVVVVRELHIEEVIKACQYGWKREKMILEAVKSGSTAGSAIHHANQILGPDPFERIGPLRR